MNSQLGDAPGMMSLMTASVKNQQGVPERVLRPSEKVLAYHERRSKNTPPRAALPGNSAGRFACAWLTSEASSFRIEATALRAGRFVRFVRKKIFVNFTHFQIFHFND